MLWRYFMESLYELKFLFFLFSVKYVLYMENLTRCVTRIFIIRFDYVIVPMNEYTYHILCRVRRIISFSLFFLIDCSELRARAHWRYYFKISKIYAFFSNWWRLLFSRYLYPVTIVRSKFYDVRTMSWLPPVERINERTGNQFHTIQTK